MSRIFLIWSIAPFLRPTGLKSVEYPRVGICRWSWRRRLHQGDDDSRHCGPFCVVWCSRRYPWLDRRKQAIVRAGPLFRRKRFLSIFGSLVTTNVHVLDIFMSRGCQEEVVCNLPLEYFRFGCHLQMKCFENYFEKSNYTISNIWVSYMRGMKCFIHEGYEMFLGGII